MNKNAKKLINNFCRTYLDPELFIEAGIEKFFIAGNCMNYILGQTSHLNDIDIFPVIEQDTENNNSIEDSYGNNFYTDTVNEWREQKLILSQTEFAVTIKGPKAPIQFCAKGDICIENLVGKFDFSCCQVGALINFKDFFLCSEFYYTRFYENFLITKEIKYNLKQKEHKSIGSLIRLFKYYKMGLIKNDPNSLIEPILGILRTLPYQDLEEYEKTKLLTNYRSDYTLFDFDDAYCNVKQELQSIKTTKKTPDTLSTVGRIDFKDDDIIL